MAKLDVVAKAGPSGNSVGGRYHGTVLLSVARADGSPVTGLTGGFEIYNYLDANISSGLHAKIIGIYEQSPIGHGAPGVYFIDWWTGDSASLYPLAGIYYVTVTVQDGADLGQTVASYYVET